MTVVDVLVDRRGGIPQGDGAGGWPLTDPGSTGQYLQVGSSGLWVPANIVAADIAALFSSGSVVKKTSSAPITFDLAAADASTLFSDGTYVKKTTGGTISFDTTSTLINGMFGSGTFVAKGFSAGVISYDLVANNRLLWIPVNSGMSAGLGAPTWTTLGAWPNMADGWKLHKAGTADIVNFPVFMLPNTWTGTAIQVGIVGQTVGGVASGNVVFECVMQGMGDNVEPIEHAYVTFQDLAQVSNNNVHQDFWSTTFTPTTAGTHPYLRLSAGRVGSSGADTEPLDYIAFGLIVIYQSKG